MHFSDNYKMLHFVQKYNLILISVLLIGLFSITSCKKHFPDIPENILCNGNGENNYFPLKIGNTWDYSEYGSPNSNTQIIGDTLLNEKQYFIVKDNQQNSENIYLRMATNGDIFSYYSDSLEFLYIPANPAIGQVICTYPNSNSISSRRVLAINETREIGGCVYFGVIKIQDYNQSDVAYTTYYYKKGLGLVESLTWGTKQIIDVKLN